MTTDYQDFTTKDTPEEERRRLNIGDVWNNCIKCKKCGDVIRSKNRHDFRYCSCKSVAVDGGSWYCKRVGELGDWEELSEPYNDVKEKN